jgi:hypothetical protein
MTDRGFDARNDAPARELGSRSERPLLGYSNVSNGRLKTVD